MGKQIGKENPGVGRAGAMDISSTTDVEAIPPAVGKVNSRHWLHVHRDGTEERFDHDPSYDLPCKFIWVIELPSGEIVEETWVRTAGDELRVMPHGAGWNLYAEIDDHFTIWRRPQRRGGRS